MLGYAVLIVVNVLVLLGFATYVRLAVQKYAVAESWRCVKDELNRRHDLSLALISAISTFQKDFSPVILNNLKRSWDVALNIPPNALPSERERPENILGGVLKDAVLMSENYPELVSSERYRRVAARLSAANQRINVERLEYNKVVRKYNSLFRIFPVSLIAKSLKFKKAAYFELSNSDAHDTVNRVMGLNNPARPGGLPERRKNPR